jgi:penicillin V acylase-like amidase (Ntn superfamily)
MVAHLGKELPVKALANNDYNRSVEEWNKNLIDMKIGKPVSVKSSSLKRFIIAAKRASEFKGTNSLAAVKNAFNTLNEVSGQKTNGSPTRWSIVFDTKNLYIYFKTIINSAIREIHLKELDFSCKSPIKMIDINERLSGDITNQLKAYSTKMHFGHAFSALKKWGSEIDPDELMKQIKFIEEFPCMDYPVRK